MNDELLFERLASHGGPAALDGAFEDQLFAILQRDLRRQRSFRPALLLAATLALVLTITAAFAVGSGLIRPPWLDRLFIPIPSPTSTIVPIPSPTSTIAASGHVLTWTRVAVDERSLARLEPGSIEAEFRTTRVVWVGDRYVLVDELRSGRAVSISSDGRVWELLDERDPGWDSYSLVSASSAIATWDHETVLWTLDSRSSSVSILRPPDEPVTKDFEGGVGAVGIGPAGIVVRVHSALDFDAYVTSVLGPGWVEHMVSFSFQDGVLLITTDDDRALEVVWADEGFEPGDVADRGFGWYSPNGTQWTPIPGFPANVSQIVGVSDGFIADGADGRCDGCRDTPDGWGMWHSPDGLSWRKIGPATDGSFLPWGDGALVTDGAGRFDLWTREGKTELLMAEALAAGWAASNVAFGSGPFGFASVNANDHQVIFTPNRVDWTIQPLSPEMAAAAGSSRYAYRNVAVGEGSVVVLLWAEGPESGPSLWVGALEP
jgi:hypothetical protein